MKAFLSASLTLVALSAALAACGDDSATGGSAPGGGNTGGTPSTGGSNAGGGGGAPIGGGGVGGSGGTPECVGLVAGPITPVEVTDEFFGSEDIAFDGAGNIWGKDGDSVLRVDAGKNQVATAQVPGQAYGLRFGSNGNLFIARPDFGSIVEVEGDVVTDFATGLSGPNGVYPDFDGNLWVTEFGAGRVIKIDMTGAKTTIVTGVGAPNGVVLDVARNLLFYSSYSQGKVFRVDPAGETEPVEVAEIDGAAIDGLVLDSCGNVYAVDQPVADLYRLNLDGDANLVGEPELIAHFPQNVANAQFGSGAGWNATSLYVAGNPGFVYEVPVGVGGAPVPTP